MRKLPKKLKENHPPKVTTTRAASAGPVIGIFVWNSPKYAETQKDFFEFLKKSIEMQGGTAYLYPISGGSDFLNGNEKLDDHFQQSRQERDRALAQTFPHAVSSQLNLSSDGSRAGIAFNYSLPTRDLVADQIEVMVQEDRPDGIMLVPWSIHSMVGMLMATVRCGIPAIFFPHYSSWSAYSQTLQWSRGKTKASETPYSYFSLALLVEVLGLSRMGTLEEFFSLLTSQKKPAKAKDFGEKSVHSAEFGNLSEQFKESVQWSGKRIVEMAGQKISPRRFFSSASFHNAICVDAALGGSTETVLHLNALAREAEVPLHLSLFNEMYQKVLPLAPMNSMGEFSLEDFAKFGGIVSLLGALHAVLKPSPTVLGKNIVEVAKGNTSARSKFKWNKPFKKHGSLAALTGNIAREGALFRISGIKDQWLVYSGTAKVFDLEEDCVKAVQTKKIKSGDVIVLRYYGPKGCPGMPHLTALGKILQEKKLDETVAVITDGRLRLSGKTPALVQLSPEAASGSPLAAIQDGDIIAWDFFRKNISLRVTETEIKVRRARWKEQVRNMKNSFLYRYCKYAAPSSQGAILV